MNAEWTEDRTVAWLARVFEASTSGPSLFDRGVFFRLGEVAREGVDHDRIVVVTYDAAVRDLRVAAHAGREGPVEETDRAARLFASSPNVDAPEFSHTRCIDHSDQAPPRLREFMANESLGSCVLVPLSVSSPALRAWMLLGWHEPSRATPSLSPRLDGLARVMGALLPTAHDQSRGSRLSSMLDRLPHAVFALGAADTILEANRTAQQLFAANDENLRGRNFDALLNPASQAMYRAILVDGAPVGTHVLEVLTREGPMLVDAVISAVSDDSTVVRQVYLQDARRRIADEAELESRAEALAFLRELAEKVAGELNVGSAFDRVAQLITARLPVRSVAIARCDGAQQKLSLVASRGFSNAALNALRATVASAVREPPADGAGEIPPAVQEAIGADRPSMLVPLRHADQLVGVALFSGGSRLSNHTRELLLAASRTIAVALHASIEFGEVARLAAERRQLLDSIPTLVFRLDANTGATLYANAAIETSLGRTVAASLGLPGIEGMLADAQERLDMIETREAVMSGAESCWIDRRFLDRDGRQRILRMRLYPVDAVTAENEADVSIEGIAQDVTDEIESRKQLIQADRLASLGMLAAGVAHEINNPTAFISLGVQQLARLVAQMPEESESIGTARKRMGDVLTELADGVQRIVQIVGELKLFARIPESAFSTPVDVNRLITSAVTLARSELRNRARVEVDLGDLPPLPGDHARLGQVFVNLLINAAQAIPPGDEERNRILVRTRAFNGYVQVDVSDTGVGIPRENLNRIFDPFFTTKAPGEGTGLGLAISFDLVKRAGGTIEVESEVGRGTAFSVKLPVRQFVPPRGSRPQIATAPLGGRVLVVEDEQHLGVAVARALASRYMVELAPDAATALERIEAGRGCEYDAVLCDLRMPGMDGRALFDAVCTRWPEQARRFIFLTGAGFGSEYEPFIRTTDRPVVEKPFDMDELEEIVANVVASGSQPPSAPAGV